MEQNNYQRILQKPLGSGFNVQSTATEVMNGTDLTGKVAIVTGGYAGIGLEATKVLSAAGATVIVPARDTLKARRNLESVANIEVEEMDLMVHESIMRFTEKFSTSGRPLHLLINNAGIMWVPLRRDSRGYESQLSTNHLGHFQLTAQLWPALKKAKRARVINVSSFGHHMSAFNFNDPNFLHHDYETLTAYGQSKTANILFTVELDNLAKEFGVRAYSLHPGSVVGTDLPREAPMKLFQQMGTQNAEGNIYQEVARKLKTIPQGAATTIWCAVSPMLNDIGGVYCNNADIDVMDDGNIEHKYDEPATQYGLKRYAIDKTSAKRLWKLSEEMTGVIFDVK
ncbi:MAG: SDR family NAD(P)-dependent oxidoreductase [Bacteroidetes bacterium]|nr:SDR family NAD(P)-dependent oxidoreductase [Bacteroidota bacterium]